MRRKISALIIVFILVFCCLLTGYSSINLASKGSGEDYSFYAIQDFTSLSVYEYDESDANYWDYYMVEYDVNVPSIEYNWYTSKVNFNKTMVVNILTKVETENVKGIMAHSKGIYYLRESAFGTTLEVLFDTVYEVTAFKLSGALARLLVSLSEENFNYDFNKWICFDYSGGASCINDALRIINHFYDREILSFFDNHIDEIESKNSVYKWSDISIAADELHDWFKLLDTRSSTYCSYIGFEWEVTECDLTLDISKANKPQLKFSISAYYPHVHTTIECGGTLKYNNVDNTVLNIPQEVQDAWKSFDGYAREF